MSLFESSLNLSFLRSGGSGNRFTIESITVSAALIFLFSSSSTSKEIGLVNESSDLRNSYFLLKLLKLYGLLLFTFFEVETFVKVGDFSIFNCPCFLIR